MSTPHCIASPRSRRIDRITDATDRPSVHRAAHRSLAQSPAQSAVRPHPAAAPHRIAPHCSRSVHSLTMASRAGCVGLLCSDAMS
eukprot:CAMPEP_0115865580 /NCGR_PEP_ID=MMETSP0287-20121206/19796_1 /TAXON_ID=412157 /ORGANISM="Chrysochromulina rotalis, Strain UIO044" /LENGTH=84 /DNA_ID=CAMNT_0003320099 /DNA_START=85 /DNA_END=339 /DNA_ORIENTATION=-